MLSMSISKSVGCVMKEIVFGTAEVAIVNRFGDELYLWVDIDVLEPFSRLSRTEQYEYLEVWRYNGDDILSYLYCKTVYFNLVNGRVNVVEREFTELGLVSPKVVRLFG